MKDNKLIAEFMSGEHPLAEVTHEAHHNYDTSWDWLMPVVDKIEIEGFDPHSLIDNAFGSREIEDVYDACVACIKALNYQREKWDERTRIEEGLDHKG